MNYRFLLCAALGPVAFAAPAVSEPAALSAFTQSVDELIEQGRRELAQGKLAEAQASFERAAELDSNSPRTRVWLVRCAIAQGAFEDALVEVDDLRAANAPAADADYLYGLALLGFTKATLASGGGGAFTQSQFEDAAAALERSLGVDAARYADAWVALAECAWYAQDLERARTAADKAVAAQPTSPAASTMLGRVAFSQYSAASEPQPKAAHWAAARAAFEQAVKLYGAPAEPALRNALAEAHIQLGHLHAFEQAKPQASEHYAAAIGWDPSRVDFGAVRSVLGAELSGPCLIEGEKRFLASHDASDPLYATLSWWLGLSAFESAQWPACETAFRRAVALWPSYANSWYYVFRACFSQQKYAEALAALRTYDESAPEGLVDSLRGDKALNLQFIEYLVGWCADGAKHAGRPLNLDAAFLSEVLTRVEPEVSRYWNNLGLFVRDHGDALRWAKSPEATKETLDGLWKRALAAYERALELEPENPNYLNDTAVMFHYYLERDYDKALSMYERAAVLADQMLARKDLPTDVREVVKIAQRDAKNNTMKLKRLMEKLARGEKPGPEDANN